MSANLSPYHFRIMPVPPFEDHLLPALRILGDGGTWTSIKLADKLADHFQLSAADRAEMLPSGVRARYWDRAYWSLTYLLGAGLLSRPERGKYEITPAGRELLAKPPSRLTKALLAERYPEFRLLMGTSAPATAGAAPLSVSSISVDESDTPSSRLDSAIQELESALADELLERVARLTPAGFEKLVLRLLSAMGYASDSSAIHHTGKTGDEGIDGIVSQDHLGLDRIFIQAKNRESAITGPEMSSFIGALDQKRGNKGVFVTRSSFTPQARAFAANGTKQVIMVDGERLARLMIRFGVGVTAVREVRVCRMDQDSFDELEV